MGLGLGLVIRRYDIISNEIILLVGSDGRYQSFIIRLVKNRDFEIKIFEAFKLSVLSVSKIFFEIGSAIFITINTEYSHNEK